MTDIEATPDDLDDDLGDLAAERDDSDPAEALPALYDPLPVVFTGLCVGGPYANRTVTSRYPKGFLLVDRPTARAWLYDSTGDTFTCRDGMTPMTADTAKRLRAAEEPDYDVMAYDIEEVSA